MSKNGNIIILGLFVDDMIISFDVDDEQEVMGIKKLIMKRFELTDIGDVKQILGMIVERHSGYIYVHQQIYIEKLLQTHNLIQCRTSDHPGDQNIQIIDNAASVDNHAYRSVVGALSFLSQYTRPDITHSVNMTARFMNAPTLSHMRAAMKIVRYLASTTRFGLNYINNNTQQITINAYCDADWGGDKNDSKSTTGYCVYVNANLISWSTKKQQTVALSTAEAELMAVVEVEKETAWTKMMIESMGMKVNLPIKIKSDNQSAVKITVNDIDHDRIKHFRIRFHYIRDLIDSKEIEVEWCTSQQQIADIFTKTLTAQPFIRQRDRLVFPTPSSSHSSINHVHTIINTHQQQQNMAWRIQGQGGMETKTKMRMNENGSTINDSGRTTNVNGRTMNYVNVSGRTTNTNESEHECTNAKHACATKKIECVSGSTASTKQPDVSECGSTTSGSTTNNQQSRCIIS